MHRYGSLTAAASFCLKIEAHIALRPFLDSARQVQFRPIGVEIDVAQGERDEFDNAKPGVGEKRDDRLVASLVVVRKGVGKAGVMDSFDRSIATSAQHPIPADSTGSEKQSPVIRYRYTSSGWMRVWNDRSVVSYSQSGRSYR